METHATSPWYQFKVTLISNRPAMSQVSFPEDPEHNKVGKTIHNYLLQSGMYKSNPDKRSSLGEVVYLATETVDLASLRKLQAKFAVKGAVLIETESQSDKTLEASEQSSSEQSSLEFATREEFESLKKQSQLADAELASLERELRQLKNLD